MEEDMEHVDHLHYDKKPADWGFIADNFVFQNSLKDKKRVTYFIKGMHVAKVNTERKMRTDLDLQV